MESRENFYYLQNPHTHWCFRLTCIVCRDGDAGGEAGLTHESIRLPFEDSRIQSLVFLNPRVILVTL